ncbi:RagB/SusD family nutrient uptake outer membrane protein [Pseudoflavitalea rhizosphaerae]|uniref:RagB/SusD family nutrient uptake outer membrane protein n=1 Tax=Pseudoflavitalea rhizosphaerae TaxID=1884793 RepID=UPI000F8C31B9|nr:RagB/SusD family nutrient uptake outer membrane protein [Pseudoflavitalea rhizosphaerae]
MNYLYRYIILLAIIASIANCKKSSFLDAKPEDRLIIPETLQDMDLILDNDRVMNGLSTDGLMPIFGEIACDDHYTPQRWLDNFDALSVNLYSWNDNIYSAPSQYYGYSYAYRAIFYANTVLESIEKIKKDISNEIEYNRIKGSGLFHRAHAFLQLAQVFAPPYDQQTSSSSLGLPLRLTSDINENLKRSTLKETYDKIIDDLQSSIELLPDHPAFKTRPSKAAAYGLLARTFLFMNDYNNALSNANKSLGVYNELLDYNYIDSATRNPFARFNNEVIFSCNFSVLDNLLLLRSRTVVDTALQQSYNVHDLRKGLFFRKEAANGPKAYSFRGSYDGSADPFCGVATDEMYLISAECNARLNNTEKAMDDLNTLMAKRWRKTENFVPFTATSSQEALDKVLIERRKELLYRGIRWSDLRRLNLEGANISIKRIVNGSEIILPPNSLHYTFLIPPDVIQLNPEIEQNKR